MISSHISSRKHASVLGATVSGRTKLLRYCLQEIQPKRGGEGEKSMSTWGSSSHSACLEELRVVEDSGSSGAEREEGHERLHTSVHTAEGSH